MLERLVFGFNGVRIVKQRVDAVLVPPFNTAPSHFKTLKRKFRLILGSEALKCRFDF